MKRNIIKALAATAVVALGVGAAQAQTVATTDFEVKVRIVDGCSVTVNGGDVVFSDRTQIYDDFRDVQLDVSCNPGATGVSTYTLALNGGLSGDRENRHMVRVGGAEVINYSVHTLATCAAPIWGDNSGATQTIPGTITVPGGPVSHNVRVCMTAAGQTQPATSPALGQYADILQVQLNY